MAAGSNIEMLPTVNGYPQWLNGNSEYNLQHELEMILQAPHNERLSDRERSFDIHRSGSAPPTVEGSLNAVGNLYRNSNFSDVNGIASGNVRVNNAVLTEDEIRSHPAYLSYYYSHEHINPRLPPPLLSKEDWRVVQRFQSSGSQFEGVGNLRKYKAVDDGDRSSLFSMQPGLPLHKVDKDLMGLRDSKSNNLSRNASAEGLDSGSDGFTEFQCPRFGARRKSLDDVLQEGKHPASLSRHPSSPASQNACSHLLNTTGTCDPHQAGLHDQMESLESLHTGAASPGMTGAQSQSSSFFHSFGTAMDSSLSRSTTPEQHPVGRSPSSIFPPVGCRIWSIEKNGVGMKFQNDQSSGTTELGEIANTLSALSLSSARLTNQESQTRCQLQMDLQNQLDFPCNMSSGCTQTLPQQQLRENPKAENLSFSTNYSHMARKNGVVPNLNASKISSSGDVSIQRRTSSSSNLRSKMNTSGHGSLERSNLHYRNANIPVMDFTGPVPGDCSLKHKMKSVINNHLDSGSALGGNGIGDGLNRVGNQGRPDLHSPAMDLCYTNYLQRISAYATHSVAGSSDPPVRNYFSTSDGDFDGIQKACLATLLSQQKQQYKLPLLAKSGNLNLGYHRNSLHCLSMPYLENLMPKSMLPSDGSGSFLSEQTAYIASMVRSSIGGSVRSSHFDIDCNAERRNASSLLDKLKSNKTRSLALSDIVGHVVEFSTDQHGSRFIQQKLETAALEEKDKIFPEIIPHTRTLMTDVFGNYVIQKFLDHGTESQRMELASQLTGHVLPLSLQMYGCRVIQKALEMIGMDQQTQLVAELDGSVMKCIHDQHGNHVIQKCIECIPEDRIQFIISAFCGHVVALSTHPYGCRVIQRVLEHSKDMNTQKIIMDEIMQSVCSLAQDQYGNYVIQHVLEHGKPQERSAIISKLAGQIVMMSQQKFASNVVEKCLIFGGPKERQLLVNEILGSTDENEPLQVMMKDPFGNYVVQKVLETCNDQNLELILSRIRIHLSSLKKYTYGKHIVSRVEKLITNGEKRIGSSSSVSSKAN